MIPYNYHIIYWKRREEVIRFIIRLRTTINLYLLWAWVHCKSNIGIKVKATASPLKNLLLLDALFPPIVTGGAYRPLALVKYGIKLGWTITVIADAPKGELSAAGKHLLQSLPNEARVERIVPASWAEVTGWYPKIDGGLLNAFRGIRHVFKVYSQNFPDIIVASGPPFHNFIAAYYLSRYYRAKLALDYRDEWTECPFSFVKTTKADRKWEARCLNKADLVFFTTQSQLEHQVNAFPTLKPDKCKLIPNGWEPEDFLYENRPQKNFKTKNKISILYAGMLFKNYGSKKMLIELEEILRRRVDLRERLKFQFIGAVEESLCADFSAGKFAFPEIFEFRNHIPKSEIIDLMKESSALLIFNDIPMERYLGGKFFEYLASGRPILVFGKKGEMADIVKKFKAGFVVSLDVPKELEAALDEITESSSFKPLKDEIARWLALHTRQFLAEKMFGYFEDLVK